MDWYKGNEEVKVFKLDKPVNELITDVRLANYEATEITSEVTKTSDNSRVGEPTRLKLELPETDKPLVVDIKVPYHEGYGGVGTGMDWTLGGQTFWKSDYYERVSDIVEGVPTKGDANSNNLGSYISDDYLDVTNKKKRYEFSFDKINEEINTDGVHDAVIGATFKLVGPQPSEETKWAYSDEKGKVEFKDLVPGIYDLIETRPAQGYEKSNTGWTVTVTREGKIYIRDNNPGDTITVNGETKDKTSKLIVSESTTTRARSANLSTYTTGLEMGDNLISSPVRADGWEVVDNTSSTQPTKREDASDSEFGQLIDTKIIEINKTNNRYKQVFIYKEGYAKKNRNIKFHRAYDNYNISPSEVSTRVFQVPTNTNLANINESSDIDAIAGKTDISKNIRFTAEGTKKIQTTNINTKYPGTILIEVETNYNENYPIGLGSNYNFNTTGQYGNKCWLEKSYANEAGVPVVKTTVNHTITFDGNGGTWKMDPVTVEEGTVYELPGSSFIAPTGKEFDGWLVNGQKKNPGDRITVTSDLKIQAQWRDKAPEQVTVLFSPGEGSGTMQEQKVNVGSNYQLPANGFTAPTGKEFKAWSVNGVEYQPGASITVNADITITALWKEKDPLDNFTPEKGKDILISGDESAKLVQITNKQGGITPKVFKQNSNGRPLEGAKFTIKKMTDNTYKTKDDNFTPLQATSDEYGNVSFKDKDGNEVKLEKGFYVLTEDEAPTGYKKIIADWEIEVRDVGGRMYAVYNGPEETPSSLVSDNEKSKAGESKETDQIKFKSRLTYINPEAKSFVQRIYVDTRNYKGNDLLNVQITPINKREEIDTPGQAPKTTTQGVKTAYRTTYQIANPDSNVDITNNNIDRILRTYDLSKPDMSILNTARWRPFDWGFDEDQLNLGKGVYIIDVEGYFDDNITKDEIGKIDLHVDFYKGARKFEQVVYDENGKESWYDGYEASYQAGMENIKKIVEAKEGKEKADTWFKEKPADQKYQNFLSKKVTYAGKEYIAGRVTPVIEGEPFFHADTSIDISPLYNSEKPHEIPENGMTVINDEESFNITFSKHGRDNPDWDVNGNEIANRRLEGGVFKLQQQIGPYFVDLPESYVASAFNGYFGFRGLKPGRYRLMEVKAPNGYKPITQPLLYLTIAYNQEDIKDEKTGEIIAGKGSGYVTLEYTNANGVYEYVPESARKQGGQLVDFVTAATAKHMGKIVNEKIVDSISFKKVSESGTALKDAEFEVYYKDKIDNNLYDKLDLYEKKSADGTVERMVNKAGDSAPSGFTKVDKFTSDKDGLIEFKFDRDGYYAIKEIKAPVGYITPRDYVKEFSVLDGKIKIKSDDETYIAYKPGSDPTNIVNKKSIFPSTGGSGTFIGFAIIGTAVMLLALAYFGIYQNDNNRRRSARYKK